MAEEIIIFDPTMYLHFPASNNKPFGFSAGRQCIICKKVIMGLVFTNESSFSDSKAVFSYVFSPLTRVVFGIHNIIFWIPKKSVHFKESTHHVYICKNCCTSIADMIVEHVPEIKERYFRGELIDDPYFDQDRKRSERKGCWITVERFGCGLSVRNREGYLNFQTNLVRFDEIIGLIGVNLENVLKIAK